MWLQESRHSNDFSKCPHACDAILNVHSRWPKMVMQKYLPANGLDVPFPTLGKMEEVAKLAIHADQEKELDCMLWRHTFLDSCLKLYDAFLHRLGGFARTIRPMSQNDGTPKASRRAVAHRVAEANGDDLCWPGNGDDLSVRSERRVENEGCHGC